MTKLQELEATRDAACVDYNAAATAYNAELKKEEEKTYESIYPKE